MIFNKIISHLNKRIVHIVMLLVIIATAYVNIFQNDFAFDDPTFITGWTSIQSLDNIPSLLKGSLPLGHGGLYRPIRSIFYVLNYHLWGQNTFGYHLQSLIIILSLTILVYFIVSNLTKNNLTAIIAALFFGLHPVHTESITFMTASFDSMGVIFFFLSFFLYIKYRKNKLRILYLLSLLSATIAFFTYEITLTLPLLLFLYDILFNKEIFKFKFKAIIYQIVTYLPYFVIIAFYLFIRIIHLQIITRGEYLLGNPFVTFLVQVQAVIIYIQLLFFPVNLTINHLIAPGIVSFTWAEISEKAFLSQSLYSTEVLSSIILIISLIIISIICLKKRAWVSFSIYWFFITIAPVLNIIPQGAIMTERYLLIPSFGFCMLFAILFGNFYRTKTLSIINKLLVTVILVIILSFFYTQTLYRNEEWKSSLTLWQSAYNLNPNSYINTTNLAVAYGISNDSQKALNLFQKAVTIAPDNFHTHQNLGVQYFKLNKFDLAIQEYSKAIKLQPNLSYLYTALSVAYLQNNNYDMAVISSNKAIEVGQDLDPMAYFHLGEAYNKQKKIDLAVKAYKKALQIDPDSSIVHYNLGYTYYEIKEYQLAIIEFEKALINNPRSAEIFFNLGKSLEGIGRQDLALIEYRKAIDINPQSEISYNNIGIIYTGYNKLDEAEIEFKKATSLNPNFADAFFNLAYIYKLQGKTTLAKEQLEKGLTIDPNNKKALSLIN